MTKPKYTIRQYHPDELPAKVARWCNSYTREYWGLEIDGQVFYGFWSREDAKKAAKEFR